MSPTAVKLLTWLHTQFPDGGATRLPARALAVELGCTDRTVRRAVRQLADAGFIRVEKLREYDRDGAGYRLLRYVG